MFKKTVITLYFGIVPKRMHQSGGKMQEWIAKDPRFDSGSMQFSVVVFSFFFFFSFLFFRVVR